MTATYTKPTKIPRWADTTLNILEPAEGKKDAGWVFNEVPPSSYENWRTKLVGDWFKWIDERFFDYFYAGIGVAQDNLEIRSPYDGTPKIRVVRRESGEPLVEVLGSEFLLVPPSTTTRIRFNGYLGNSNLSVFTGHPTFGNSFYMETGGIFQFAMSEGKSVVFFSNMTDGIRGMGFYRTVTDLESHLVMSSIAGENYPVIGWRPSTGEFIMNPDGGQGFKGDLGVTYGQFRLLRNGLLRLLNRAVDGTSGANLRLVNVNRTGATLAREWSFQPVADTLYLQSYNGLGALDKTYVWINTAGQWRFAQGSQLIPDFVGASGKVGEATRYFSEVHGDTVFQHTPVALWANGAANTTIAVTETIITPTSPRLGWTAYGLAVDALGRIYSTARKGVFKLHFKLNYSAVGGQNGRSMLCYLKKNGTALPTGSGFNFQQPNVNGLLNEHFVAFIDIQTPGAPGVGDYWEIAAIASAGSWSISFPEHCTLLITGEALTA